MTDHLEQETLRPDPKARAASGLLNLDAVLVLAIDTATPAVTAGVVELPDQGPSAELARRVVVDARAHAEQLIPLVLAAVADAGATLSVMDAIVCGAGPGPFTGLRVGMVTAGALGHALERPVYPVCSLDAIAHEAGSAEPLLVVTDARRREVYWAAYHAGLRVDGPHVQAPVDVPTVGYTAVAGAAPHAELLGLPVRGPEYPGPAGLVAVAAAALRCGAPPAPLAPYYLRRPDAAEPGARKRVSQR